AQAPHLDRRGRAHHPVHGGAHHRQLEAEGVDLPGDVEVLRVPRPPAGADRVVVEPVGPPPRLPDPDLDLGHTPAYPGRSRPRTTLWGVYCPLSSLLAAPPGDRRQAGAPNEHSAFSAA